MNLLPRRLMILSLVALIAAPLSADDEKQTRKKRKGERRRGFAVVRLPKGIELTDEQKAKVEALRKEYGPKVAELRKQVALTPEQRKARREAVQAARASGKSRREAIQAVRKSVEFTPEQKEARKEFLALRKEVQGKLRALLTDEQKAQLRKGRGQRRKNAKKTDDSK